MSDAPDDSAEELARIQIGTRQWVVTIPDVEYVEGAYGPGVWSLHDSETGRSWTWDEAIADGVLIPWGHTDE